MKQIFDQETEIGKWEGEDFIPGTSPWSIYVHTTVFLSRASDLIKIEQRCFLRRDVEFEEQPWIAAELRLESATGSIGQMKKMAGCLHQQFAQRARELCPIHSMVEA
jgi:hypothetical protein